MSIADTPIPGEDPGTLPESQRDGETDPAAELNIEANPQPEPDSSLPPEDDAELTDTEPPPAGFRSEGSA